MHMRRVKGILSQSNGMNLYRGCTHGCIYCDARSTCYQMDHPFEDVEVKENAVELLEDALRRKRHRCMIGTGSMSDPYIPLEQQLCHMRCCLELIQRYGFGVAFQTKSPDFLRDIDLMEQINHVTKCVVQMTITTYDDALCRILEPCVAPTSARLAALHACRKRGIPTVVWLTPLLPYINDTPENLRSILRACRDAGVWGILSFGMGLTLREGNREYYYRKLNQHFPGLKEQYQRVYGNAYELPSPHAGDLYRIFWEDCCRYGICTDQQQIFAYLHAFEDKQAGVQLSLF